MNKPFYGVATIPKSQRCTLTNTQPKSHATSTYQGPAPTTATKKKHSMGYLNGRNS